MKSNGHASDVSPLRDFDFLWPRLQEFLVEREDANARSIEQALKSPKKSADTPKAKAPAVPAKAAPAAPTNANAAAAPSKAVSKKADAKSLPKGKSKGHGKPLSAEEKAKTLCIFHQMPSGCVHGAKCACSHSKAPPPKPKREGSADPKTLATVAILAATMLQPSQAGLIEWAADSGAGRHLASFEALNDQGHDRSFFDGFPNQSHESLRFSTGGGQKDSSLSQSLYLGLMPHGSVAWI